MILHVWLYVLLVQVLRITKSKHHLKILSATLDFDIYQKTLIFNYVSILIFIRMLLKHRRICSRITEQCLKNNPTRRSIKTCRQNPNINSAHLRTWQRAKSLSVRYISTRGLGSQEKLGYVRGSDSERATEFLLP